MVDNYEPVAWTKALIEPACAVDHSWLATIYAMATRCWYLGRVEEGSRYCDEGQAVILRGRETMPPGSRPGLAAYMHRSGGPSGLSNGLGGYLHAVRTHTRRRAAYWSFH